MGSKFIDHLRVCIRGGAGGQGLAKYGGRGGNGGNIVFEGSKEKRLSLFDVKESIKKKPIIGKSGDNSKKTFLVTPSAPDTIVKVPTGVRILNDDGIVIGEIDHPGDRVVGARGAPGGSANTGFVGRPGERRHVRIDLRLIADCGLVGFPNAGKSTLLAAVSRAQPKIAEYPFTTMKPQIGVMQFNDNRQISVADLPGLIEGAHQNVGLGHSFLKHIERTSLLLFVIDVGGFRLDYGPHRSAFEILIRLNRELELYDQSLIGRPAMLILNKIDTDPEQRLREEFHSKFDRLPGSVDDVDAAHRPMELLQFSDVIHASTLLRQNTEFLRHRIRDRLNELFRDGRYISQPSSSSRTGRTDAGGGGRLRQKLVTQYPKPLPSSTESTERTDGTIPV